MMLLCADKSWLNTANTTNTIQLYTGEGYDYSYGNSRNWYSATAGSGKVATVNGVAIEKNMSANSDICPINWRLPRGSTIPNTDYQPASNIGTVASRAIRSFPNNFVSAVTTSTTGGTASFYMLYLGDNYVFPGSFPSQIKNGQFVRCLAGN